MGDQTAKSFADDSTLPPNGMGTLFFGGLTICLLVVPVSVHTMTKKGALVWGNNHQKKKGLSRTLTMQCPQKGSLSRG